MRVCCIALYSSYTAQILCSGLYSRPHTQRTLYYNMRVTCGPIPTCHLARSGPERETFAGKASHANLFGWRSPKTTKRRWLKCAQEAR